MLLQTNSYIVPKDKRPQHQRLVQRFRQTLTRLGCDHFEAYEQVGANWSPADTTGRFVQLMRFRDRKHQLAVQAAERNDPTAQGLIKEFCELINFPYQQQQGLFAVGFYHSLLPTFTPRATADTQTTVPEAGEQFVEQPFQSEEPAKAPQRPVRVSAREAPASATTDDEPLSLLSTEETDESTEADAIDADADALLDEMESSAEGDDFNPSDSEISGEDAPARRRNGPG